MKKLLLLTTLALLSNYNPLAACCTGEGEEITEKLTLPPNYRYSYDYHMKEFDTMILPSIRERAKEVERRYPEIYPNDEISVKRREKQSLEMEAYLRKNHHDKFIDLWFSQYK